MISIGFISRKVEFMEINELHILISKKGYVINKTETELEVRTIE